MDSKYKHGSQPGSVSVVEVNNHVPIDPRKRPNYAPFVSRTPFLLFICCIALACIGALQVAVKRSVTIPQATPAAAPPALRIKRHVIARAEPTITSPGGYAAQITAAVAQVRRQDLEEPTPTSVVEEPPTTTTTTSEEAPDPFMGGTTTTTSGPHASYQGGSSFVELEPGDPTTTQASPTPVDEAPPALITTPPAGEPQDPNGPDGTNGPTQSGEESTFDSITSSDFVEITSGPIPTSGSSSTDRIVVSGAPPASFVEVTQVSVNAKGETVTAVTSYRPTDVGYTTFTSSFTGSDGQVSTTLVVKPAQKTDGVIPELFNGAEVQIPTGRFTMRHYIFATYAGTFIAVILKILWACVYSANKMMEPFYQLNRKSGASAKESLMADYLSSGISWWSLKIMFRGHWTMLLTVIVSLLISLLPSFATEAMTVRTTSMCTFPDGTSRRCNPIWVLNINMVRVLQTILSLISFCIIAIVFINLRRRSGISANPSSIASMATLLHHPEMLREIRSINMEASNEDVAARLAQNRYIIGTWRDMHGQDRTGIMKASVDFNSVPTASNHYRVEYSPLNNPAEPNKRPLSSIAVDKLIDGLLVFLIIGILAVALGFWFDGSKSGFNTFFLSDKFGPRFILTTAASLIAMCWLDLEREVRILSPYRKLAKRNAYPRETILAPVDGYPYLSVFGSLRRKNFFHFTVAVAAIFSDLLIIAVGSIPFSLAQMRWSFVAGTWITVSVLVYMIPVLIGLLVWRRINRKLAIPYQPNETLLRTWMGIANEGNQIRSMLDGWDDSSKKERDEHCLAQDATYWAGWVHDGNGKERWCVDKEGSRVLSEYQPYRPQ